MLFANLPEDLLWTLGGWGPSLAAVLITGLQGGKPAVKTLLVSALHWRVGFRWYLVVLFLPALTALAALGLHLILGGEAPRSLISEYGFLLIPFFFASLFTGGAVSEEFGWRGFALPRMQAGMGPARTSLLLGILWGFWHTPLFFMSGTAQAEMSLAWFVVHGIALTFLFTWIYNHTGGSLLLAILFHAAINFTPALIPTTPALGAEDRLYYLHIAFTWLLAGLSLPTLLRSKINRA